MFTSAAYRQALLKKVLKTIEDEDFKGRHKAGSCSHHFTRERKLDFRHVITFILCGVKSSLQRELDDFFAKISAVTYPYRHVSKRAFSQARRKLSFTAFQELNRHCVDYFYTHTTYKRWCGKRVFAVDGSTCVLPEHRETNREFPGKNKSRLARISFAYDPLNELVYDCALDNIHVDERTHLDQMLGKFEKGDLLLLDRGYPSFRLIKELLRLGIHFCMRMPRGFHYKIDAFMASHKKEQTVCFSQTGYRVKLKLYKIILPCGGKEILLTDIRDRKLQVKDFGLLYHLRWAVEEGYKYLKARMETPNFSGKTPGAIRQDFYAKAFIMTLESVLRFPLDKKIKARNIRRHSTKNRRHLHKINRTNALWFLMRHSLHIFLNKDIDGFLAAFDHIVLRTTEVRIRGRTFPRSPLRVIKYYQNYKRV